MRSRYLFIVIICLISSTPANSQTGAIQCDLENLYKLTVAKSPTIQRQNIQYKLAEVEKKSASSIFDYQVIADLSVNRTGNHLFKQDPRVDVIGNMFNTNSLNLSGGVQRTFRSGLTANASLNHSKVADNLPFNAFNETVGSYYADNNTSISASISHPLLRGRGKDIVVANETVAKLRIKSQQLNNQFIASSEIFNMSIGYWQYLSTSKAYEIYQSNEARINSVLEITNELVKADKKPASDLLQIQADLKDKERQTIQSKQQLFAARQNLGRYIGLNNEESSTLGLPKNDFPKVESIPSDLNLNSLLELAHRNRTDIKAIQKSLEMLSVFVDVADNNTKPQLDATLSMAYGGVDAGNGMQRMLTALTQNEGRNYNVGIGLSYLFPINNNFAEANLLSSQLQYADQEIQLKNQLRNIEVNVSIAYNELMNSIESVKKSKQSLTYYEEVFQNEQFKFQSGLTTLLNLIILQERLTFAELDYIQNQQQFAIAISNLRYETGTMFTSNGNNYGGQEDSQKSQIFYTLPKE